MFLWITLLVEPSALFSTRGDLGNPIHSTFSKAWGWLSHTNSPKYSHWVFFFSQVVVAALADPLKVMISGAPASGKGTQCELIKAKVSDLGNETILILVC
jgi:hypothetical protein